MVRGRTQGPEGRAMQSHGGTFVPLPTSRNSCSTYCDCVPKKDMISSLKQLKELQAILLEENRLILFTGFSAFGVQQHLNTLTKVKQEKQQQLASTLSLLAAKRKVEPEKKKTKLKPPNWCDGKFSMS
ncbi:Alpha-Tubulin N-Acetyltransferase 1 [Manis pentadactyla]|nr:Alpha-Tubulin N-Acetyltransferase 1 [Manis pentadactyla]